MKNYRNLFITLIVFVITSQTQAYIQSFSNHTDKTIAIGMKYKGSKNLEFIVIKPKEKQQFESGTQAIPGIKSAIDDSKANAIPDTWYYLENPPYVTEMDKNKLPWISLQFTWFNANAYKAVLEAAKAIAGTDFSTATENIKAAIQKTATNEIIKQFADADYHLKNFIKNVGKAIGHSMARSFHVDIIEDDNSIIHFITPL